MGCCPFFFILSFFCSSVNFVSTFHRGERFKFTELVPDPFVYIHVLS